MSGAWTPGPWRAGGFSSFVGVPVMAQPDKTKNTFNVCGVAAPVSREENIANANLIAAAPSLYADAAFLCDRIRELEGELTGDDAASREYFGHVLPAVIRMEDSLARARGETA